MSRRGTLAQHVPGLQWWCTQWGALVQLIKGVQWLCPTHGAHVQLFRFYRGGDPKWSSCPACLGSAVTMSHLCSGCDPQGTLTKLVLCLQWLCRSLRALVQLVRDLQWLNLLWGAIV